MGIVILRGNYPTNEGGCPRGVIVLRGICPEGVLVLIYIYYVLYATDF